MNIFKVITKNFWLTFCGHGVIIQQCLHSWHMCDTVLQTLKSGIAVLVFVYMTYVYACITVLLLCFLSVCSVSSVICLCVCCLGELPVLRHQAGSDTDFLQIFEHLRKLVSDLF